MHQGGSPTHITRVTYTLPFLSRRLGHVPRVQTCLQVSGDRVGMGLSLPSCSGLESPGVAPALTPLSPFPPPPGCSRAEGPEGHPQQSQPLGHPLGVTAGLSMGTGDAAESVIDPDMVALFEDFLGKGSARWAWGPSPHVSPVPPPAPSVFPSPRPCVMSPIRTSL